MKPLSIACLSLLTIASISSPAFSKPMEERDVPRVDPNVCQSGSFGCSRSSGLPSGGTIPSGGYGTIDPCKNGKCDNLGLGRPHVPQVPKGERGQK